MSEEIGPVDVRESEAHLFLGRDIAQPRLFSEERAAAADAAVKPLLDSAHQRARKILESHKPKIDRLVSSLESHETLDRAAVARCLGPKPVRRGEGAAPDRHGRADDADGA